MLSPQNRLVLHDAIQPPQGFELAALVGTTYTLDLGALLSLPLAFVSHGSGNNYDPTEENSVDILHALWDTMDRIYVFCEQGRIKGPQNASDLYGYAEDSIVEVAPPTNGAFHPKVWVAKYTAPDQPARYRFLCLSRNLTFDSSWDVILNLNGELTDRQYALADQHPLGEFWKQLPDLAATTVPAALEEMIDEIAHEIRRVRFELPADVEEIQFHPLIEGDTSPFPESYSDIAVVSPFLSPSRLEKLEQSSRDSILVSRLDELDTLNRSTIDAWSSVYGLAAGAIPEEADGAPEDEPALVEEWSVTDRTELTGLHAKIFALDQGWDTSLFVGSANATAAAFRHNIEFLTELKGKKHDLGTPALFPDDAITDEDESTSGTPDKFIELLVEYDPEEEEETDTDETTLEHHLEHIRTAVLDMTIDGQAQHCDDGYYLSLTTLEPLDIETGVGDVEVVCWPLSVQNTQKQISVTEPVELEFGPFGKHSLTQLFAFQVRVTDGDETRQTRFALKVPITGLPEDRNQAIMQDILSDPERFLRLLSLLLDWDSPSDITDTSEHLSNDDSSYTSTSGAGPPLLELLVETLEQNPSRITQLEQLLRDLETDETSFPSELNSLLETVLAAHRRLHPDD